MIIIIVFYVQFVESYSFRYIKQNSIELMLSESHNNFIRFFRIFFINKKTSINILIEHFEEQKLINVQRWTKSDLIIDVVWFLFLFEDCLFDLDAVVMMVGVLTFNAFHFYCKRYEMQMHTLDRPKTITMHFFCMREWFDTLQHVVWLAQMFDMLHTCRRLII